MDRPFPVMDEIAEKQYGPLLQYCLKAAGGDRQLAEDCVVEVFLRAKKLGDPPVHPNVTGWLFKTARNVVREKLREKKRYYRLNTSLERLGEYSEGVDAPFFARESEYLFEAFSNEADDGELMAIKEDLLKRLPEQDRELIRLAYEEKLPLDELARRLERSKDAVRVKLSRLTDKVTRMVNDYFDND